MLPGMTSLGEAYGDDRWNGRDPRWIAIGAGSFVAGVVAIVLAIAIGATSFGDALGLTGTYEAREPAGILAGLGVPAMLLGVVAVLPSSRRQGVGVVLGALLCLAGVALFAHAYPWLWPPAEPAMAFETSMTYFAGAVLAFGSVFSTVASYRVRNNPQGTVRMELKRQGETKTVRVSRDQYQQYKRAMRGDGGEQTQVIKEIESKFNE